MADGKKIIVELIEIATDVLVRELKRRATARKISVEELISLAQENWDDAEFAADELLKAGHEE